MPNLLAGKAVLPEFVQDAATSDALAEATLKLLTTPGALTEARKELIQVRQLLGPPGATERAAERILADESARIA
jgi:lipid-A-disaccharide synthase